MDLSLYSPVDPGLCCGECFSKFGYGDVCNCGRSGNKEINPWFVDFTSADVFLLLSETLD